tara:strand:+ start:696 stop:1034 length:339 start_codon:yes stop_codon:yes gene_type:complete
MLQTLKSDNKIEAVFEKGFFIKEGDFLLKAYDFNDDETLFGVSVSKRFFKSAVTRNKLKRRMRESVRKSSRINEVKKGASFFIIYNTSKEYSFQIIDEKVCLLIDKLISKIN